MSEIQVDLNNKVLVSLDGKILTKASLPKLTFEHNQAKFPPGTGSMQEVGRLSFRTSTTNTIYIDFGDGSEVYSEQFEDTIEFHANNPIHNYTHADNYKVSIWFEYPQLINLINIYFAPFIGEFPSQLGLYNLETIDIHSSRFESFPESFLGGVFNSVRLQNITSSVINYIPSWITSSRIETLNLHSNFNLNDKNTSNLDKLINIQGLNTFYTSHCNITNNSIPNNWKDISELRTLGLGINPITEITEELNNCKQITRLIFGIQYGVTGNQQQLHFTSWGVGVTNMNNLQALEWTNLSNAPATLPTGIETATNLKTLIASSAYRTQERIDDFVDDVYTIVTNNADIAGVDTLLRQVYLNIGNYSNQTLPYTVRPTGEYQATGGYEAGISNGSPTTAMEKIYVLVNQYDWTVVVLNETGSNNQVYAP